AGGRRVGRHHGRLDEAGKWGDDFAGLVLPAGEGLRVLGPHPRLRDDGDGALAGRRASSCAVLRSAHGCAESLLKIRSAVNGRCGKRTPVASLSAFAMAVWTRLIEPSPCAFAPSVPIVSWVSAKNTSLGGTSAKAGMR